MAFDFTFGYGDTASLVYGAATAGNIGGGAVISRFQTLISYMRAEPARFPTVVPPANQGNVATWVSWLKANWGKGYKILGWMKSKGWLNSPIGAFFKEMAGPTGTTLIQMAPWLSTQNGERVSDTTLLTGSDITLSPSNLEKLAAATTEALRWWANRVKSQQLGPQYLNIIVRNMAPMDAKDYRVPTFYNPYDENDDSGIWWKFMKDTKWNTIVSQAADLSYVEGRKEKTRLLAEAARWNTISKTLGWISMTEPIRKLQKQVGIFYDKWTKADTSFKIMNDALNKNPDLKSKYASKVSRLQGSANDVAIDAYGKISPLGMWPGKQPQSLGAAVTIVKAGIAVGALAALGIIIIYTNKLAGLLDEAGKLEREILAEVNADLKSELEKIEDEIVLLKDRLKNGAITQDQYDVQYNKLMGMKASINKQRQTIAKQAGNTGLVGKLAMAGVVGVVGIVAWKTL